MKPEPLHMCRGLGSQCSDPDHLLCQASWAFQDLDSRFRVESEGVALRLRGLGLLAFGLPLASL